MSTSHIKQQNEDDWSHVSDRQERKRIQNRLAQRNYRKNLKQRIEVLEGLAAECVESPGNPAHNEPQELALQGDCHDRNIPRTMSGSAAQNTASQFETMLGDPQIAQHIPAVGVDRHHALTMIDQHLHSYDEPGQDMPWLSAPPHNPPPHLNLPAEASVQYNTGLQPQGQPGVSQSNHTKNNVENKRNTRASREGLRLHSLPASQTSKRIRTGDEYTSDVDFEVSEVGFSRLFGCESDSSSGASWNAYPPTGDEISRSSSTSLSNAVGHPPLPPSRNANARRSSTSTSSMAADAPLSARLASAQASLKPQGFTSIEDLVTQYWTADLTDRPALADAQRLSRRRGLPRLLSTLRERASEWDDWESQGWRDEATRSAETVLVEECRRFLARKAGRGKSYPCTAAGEQQQQSIPPEEAVRLKRIFQEEVPNLYVLLDTLGQCSRRTDDDDADVGDDRSNAVVSAICRLLAGAEDGSS